MRLLPLLLPLAACGGGIDEGPWCSAEPAPEGTAPEAPTYHADVAPILEARCVRCHDEGGLAPFPLTTYEEVFEERRDVSFSVQNREMPPYLAASCCTDYFQDISLDDDEIATIVEWVLDGAPEGDPQSTPDDPPATVGGLSRVDVEVQMAEPYTPDPPAGSTDDLRCFAMDWPLAETAYVTGLEPIPGTRSVVHHLVVAALTPEAEDELPPDAERGFDCRGGGFGEIGFQNLTVLGGSLVGGDYPDGLGRKVEPGSKILVNMHYTTENGIAPDRTRIRFRVDDHAKSFEGLGISNPAWVVGDGMGIDAGDPDAVFWFRYTPTFFTKGEVVDLRSVTPHAHYFLSKMVVRILRADGSRRCLLEIPEWHFGWEQPFWFAEPIRLRPDDELYLECHFDNSAGNQPNGEEPRDIAWGGNNQDMCAALLTYTRP